MLLFVSLVEEGFSTLLVCRRRASAQQMCVSVLFSCEAVFKWKNHFSISTNAQQWEKAQQWFDRFMQCFTIPQSPVLLAAIILNFGFLLSIMGLLYFSGFVSTTSALLQAVMVVNQLICRASNVELQRTATERQQVDATSEAWLWLWHRRDREPGEQNSTRPIFIGTHANWWLRPIKPCMMCSSSPESKPYKLATCFANGMRTKIPRFIGIDCKTAKTHKPMHYPAKVCQQKQTLARHVRTFVCLIRRGHTALWQLVEYIKTYSHNNRECGRFVHIT